MKLSMSTRKGEYENRLERIRDPSILRETLKAVICQLFYLYKFNQQLRLYHYSEAKKYQVLATQRFWCIWHHRVYLDCCFQVIRMQ